MSGVPPKRFAEWMKICLPEFVLASWYNGSQIHLANLMFDLHGQIFGKHQQQMFAVLALLALTLPILVDYISI